MIYSNFDSRTKGRLTIPSDRLLALRELEERVRLKRTIRKRLRSAPKRQKSLGLP